MKPASISDIKGALKNVSPAQVTALCLRLARYKKENKELLTYLLFEADDEDAYIKNLKEEIDESFADINTGNMHWVKKSLRKILRSINKQIRFTASKTVEAELLIYFCTTLKKSKIPFHRSAALNNIYQAQIKKIAAAIASLHEDLQHDYLVQLESIK